MRVIRLATPEDLTALAAIYQRAYAQAPWNEQIRPQWALRYVWRVLQEPGAVCLVADPGAEPDQDAGQRPAAGANVPSIAGFALGAPRPYEAFVRDWEAQCEPPPGGAWPALSGRLGYVYELAVDPAWQGHGWGRRLLGELLAALRAHGCDTIVLRSSERAQAAIRLYTRYGFERFSLRERHDPAAGYWTMSTP